MMINSGYYITHDTYYGNEYLYTHDNYYQNMHESTYDLTQRLKTIEMINNITNGKYSNIHNL